MRRAVDTVSLALIMGATFVARSFSGDKAAAHSAGGRRDRARGGFIDVISPCVAFNNPPARPRATTTCAPTSGQRLDFWPSRESISVEYNEGERHECRSTTAPSSACADPPDYDPTDRVQALEYVATRREGEVVTGLLYLDHQLRRPPRPLIPWNPVNKLGEKNCAREGDAGKINAALR